MSVVADRRAWYDAAYTDYRGHARQYRLGSSFCGLRCIDSARCGLLEYRCIYQRPERESDCRFDPLGVHVWRFLCDR